MNIANNQLRRETEKKIREALLFYMETEQEPTVEQICRRASINRSTFYRHYKDIFDLMEAAEREIQHGLYQSLAGKGLLQTGAEHSAELLEAMIAYIGDHRSFYRIYLRRRDSVPDGEVLRRFREEQIMPLFQSHGVEDAAHVRYYFEYITAGFATVIRLWLENGCRETPAEMARILDQMLPEKKQP